MFCINNEDPKAFTELMMGQMQSMYKVAGQILYSDEDIADAIQETILTWWKQIDKLRKPGAFRNWMMRILVSKCYDQIREKRPVNLMEELPEIVLCRAQEAFAQIYAEKDAKRGETYPDTGTGKNAGFSGTDHIR